jgi:hypothetical protein
VAEGRLTFVGFLDLATVLVLARFAAATRGFDLCFAVPTFAAFRARAFPAGERLVAGFSRVDLPAKTRLRVDDVADE